MRARRLRPRAERRQRGRVPRRRTALALMAALLALRVPLRMPPEALARTLAVGGDFWRCRAYCCIPRSRASRRTGAAIAFNTYPLLYAG